MTAEGGAIAMSRSLSSMASLAIALVILGAIFTVLERRWPSIQSQRWWRTGTCRIDICYWFIVPLVTGAIGREAVLGAFVVISTILGAQADDGNLVAWIAAGRRAVSTQPEGLQLVEMLVLGDLFGYGAHRLLHRASLWGFHAVHHAPRELHWLSSVRLHPVNEIIKSIIQAAPLFLLGFDNHLVVGLAPIFTFYAVLIHANLRWTFGPLRYVIVSPVFHRWHHTLEEGGFGKNFAGMFPVFDILFGTFFMPAGVQPTRFGIAVGQVPERFLAQLAYPFRDASRRAGPSTGTKRSLFS